MECREEGLNLGFATQLLSSNLEFAPLGWMEQIWIAVHLGNKSQWSTGTTSETFRNQRAQNGAKVEVDSTPGPENRAILSTLIAVNLGNKSQWSTETTSETFRNQRAQNGGNAEFESPLRLGNRAILSTLIAVSLRNKSQRSKKI